MQVFEEIESFQSYSFEDDQIEFVPENDSYGSQEERKEMIYHHP